MEDVLRERNLDQSGELKIPVPGIKIHVGFTGAEFQADGTTYRKNYAIAGITCAANLAMWEFIYERVLSPPKLGSPGFDVANKIYLEMVATLNEILRYESFHNLGIGRKAFGMPEKFKHSPGATIGNLSVLTQFNLPFKIKTRIRQEYPNATDIGIVNMPKFPFQWDDEPTSDWIRYMHDSIAACQRQDARKMEAIQRYSTTKEKNMFENVVLDAPGGWPLDVTADGTVTAFGLPPLPLMTVFETQGARGSFYVWSSGLGALPDLVSALLRAFIGQNCPLDQIPEIGHFLKDRRVANPVLVLKTYFGCVFVFLTGGRGGVLLSPVLAQDRGGSVQELDPDQQPEDAVRVAGQGQRGAPEEGRVGRGHPPVHGELRVQQRQDPEEHDHVGGIPQRHDPPQAGHCEQPRLQGGVRVDPGHRRGEPPPHVHAPPVRQLPCHLVHVYENVGEDEQLLQPKQRQSGLRVRGHGVPVDAHVRGHEQDLVSRVHLFHLSGLF